jgi:hypothetical protein
MNGCSESGLPISIAPGGEIYAVTRLRSQKKQLVLDGALWATMRL